ncbi:3-deoxy-7-phosphoheptulonate synthase [Fusarium solani]
MSQFFIQNKNVGNQAESEDWRIRGYNPLTPPDLLQHEIPPDRRVQEDSARGPQRDRRRRQWHRREAAPARRHRPMLHPRPRGRPRLLRPPPQGEGEAQG